MQFKNVEKLALDMVISKVTFPRYWKELEWYLNHFLASGLGELRNNHDPNCTYEGENHIIIQQTSNWLFRFWPLVLKRQTIVTPLNTVEFLNNAQEILVSKFTANSVEDLIEPKSEFWCIGVQVFCN